MLTSADRHTRSRRSNVEVSRCSWCVPVCPYIRIVLIFILMPKRCLYLRTNGTWYSAAGRHVGAYGRCGRFLAPFLLSLIEETVKGRHGTTVVVLFLAVGKVLAHRTRAMPCSILHRLRPGTAFPVHRSGLYTGRAVLRFGLPVTT